MAEENILSQLINYLKPKAHDAIDKVTNAWKQAQQQAESSQLQNLPPEVQELIQGAVMGSIGGGGSKIGKSLLNRLKGRTPKSKLTQFEQTQRENILRKDINRKRYYAQQGAKPYKPYKPEHIEGESTFFKDYIKNLFEDVSKAEF